MRNAILTALVGASVCLPSLRAEKKAIHPKEFAKGGPFTPGILSGGTLHVSGQVGRDLKTGQYPAAFEDEVKTCLQNIGIILKEAGMGFQDAVRSVARKRLGGSLALGFIGLQTGSPVSWVLGFGDGNSGEFHYGFGWDWRVPLRGGNDG